MLTVGPVCHRCTTVDFERPTSDEAVVEARRDELPVRRSKTLEYAVHGKFRMREGGAAFPDTFWLSPRELKNGGCSTADIQHAREAFEEEQAMAGQEACEGLSSEEESEDEGSGEEGQGELGGEDATAEGENAAAETVRETVPGTVPLPPIFGGGA